MSQSKRAIKLLKQTAIAASSQKLASAAAPLRTPLTINSMLEGAQFTETFSEPIIDYNHRLLPIVNGGKSIDRYTIAALIDADRRTDEIAKRLGLTCDNQYDMFTLPFMSAKHLLDESTDIVIIDSFTIQDSDDLSLSMDATKAIEHIKTNLIDDDSETKPNKSPLPLYGKDPNKVFNSKRKRGRSWK